MAVPDTNTFSLQDVITELGLGATSSLANCFSAAQPGFYDPAYEGSKDRLSNFRNYGGGGSLAVSPNPFVLGQNDNSAQIVNVLSDSSWTATVTMGGAWISIVGGAGSGDGSFTALYTGGSNMGRVGTIRVETSGGTYIDITIDEVD